MSVRYVEPLDEEAWRIAQLAAKLFPYTEEGHALPYGSPDALREQVRQARALLAEARGQVRAAQPPGPEPRVFDAD